MFFQGNKNTCRYIYTDNQIRFFKKKKEPYEQYHIGLGAPILKIAWIDNLMWEKKLGKKVGMCLHPKNQWGPTIFQHKLNEELSYYDGLLMLIILVKAKKQSKSKTSITA